MRKKSVAAALAVILALAAGIALAGDIVDWRQAAEHYGRYRTVEGRVVAAKCLPKVCFLNFSRNYRSDFTAVIFAADLPNFPTNPEKYYLDKNVRVSGIVKEYKGKPEIILEEASQIDIVGE